MPDRKHKKDLPHVHKVRPLDELPAYTRGKCHTDCFESAMSAMAHINELLAESPVNGKSTGA